MLMLFVNSNWQGIWVAYVNERKVFFHSRNITIKFWIYYISSLNQFLNCFKIQISLVECIIKWSRCSNLWIFQSILNQKNQLKPTTSYSSLFCDFTAWKFWVWFAIQNDLATPTNARSCSIRLSIAELEKENKRQEEMLKVLRRHLVTTGQDTEPTMVSNIELAIWFF